MRESFGTWKVSCRLTEKSSTLEFKYLGYADEVFSEAEKNLGYQYSIVKFEKIDSSKIYKNKELIFRDIKKYLGIPYIGDGDNPQNGFDCSGFVQYIFKQIGINLPRTSYEQYDVSEEIEFCNIQIGDLLFNKDKSHVGIYIGDGEFIHASHTGDVVKISKLFDSDMMIIRRVENNDSNYITRFIFNSLLQESQKKKYEMSYGRKNNSCPYYIEIKDKTKNEVRNYRLYEDKIK